MLRFRNGPGQALLQLAQSLLRIRVRGGRFLASQIGSHHELDLLTHMVEGQHLVVEHEAGVRDAQIILGQLGQAFQLPHHVVGKKADRATSKRRQARDTRRRLPGQ